jgi:hypothetical protein
MFKIPALIVYGAYLGLENFAELIGHRPRRGR